MLEKGNMFLLTKGATDKDRSLKTQLLMATDSQKNWENKRRASLEKFGYFGDEKTDFNIEKKDFPENTLCYVNRWYLSAVTNGELAIYNNNFILGQLIVAANQPNNIDEYYCKKDEIKLVTCIYDKSTGQFHGLKLQLSYMVLRGVKEESFFSYVVNEKKSSVHYSVVKERIPNAFVSTCFKKHFREVTEEWQHDEEFSTLQQFNSVDYWLQGKDKSVLW